MATVGFSASDEQKAKIDELAEQFVKDNGGNKGDFLNAMVTAFESCKARQELAGRAEEIDHVEKLLDGLRVAYMSSLSMAKMAKEEASTAAAAEIQKAKAVQDTLQAKIDELKAGKADAEEKAATVDTLKSELEAVKKELAEEKERARKAEEERADLSSVFKTQVQELTTKAEGMSAEVAQAKEQAEAFASLAEEVKRLKEDLASAQAEASASALKMQAMEQEHKAELERLRGRYEEKSAVAAQKAENEKTAAVLEAKEESAKKLEKMQEEYSRRLLEVVSPQSAKKPTAKAKKDKNEGQ